MENVFERVDSLDLTTLNAGDSVIVTAGEEPQAFTYSFSVVKPGETPLCDLSQTSPEGKKIGPFRAVLEGTGRWTTPKQNPLQEGDPLFGRPRQEIAVSIGWGLLSIGGSVIVLDATEPRKLRMDRYELMPECIAISLNRKNARILK